MTTKDEATRLLAQLLAGCPIPADITPGEAPKPFDQLIAAILVAPEARLKAFNETLALLPGSAARDIRLAVFQQQAEPDTERPSRPVALVPKLPADAYLDGDPLEMLRDHWVGRYCAYAQRAASMSPIDFHLSLALAAGAAAIARRVCLRWSALTIYPNLYVLIVAPSTLYHKTTALNVMRGVVKLAGLDEFLLPDMQTPESLTMEMGLIKPPTFKEWGKSEQAQWQESRRFAGQRLWVLDEAGRLLDAFKRDHTAGLLSLLLALYDCPDHETLQTVGRGKQTILNGYLSFVGATTPDAIRGQLRSARHWSDGLWARIALIGKPDEIPPFVFNHERIEPPAELAGELHALAFKRLPIPSVVHSSDGVRVDWPTALAVQIDNDALDAWQRYTHATGRDMLVSGAVDEMIFSPYGRLATTAMKVALVLATLDEWRDVPRLTLRHWTIAQLITERWRAYLHRLVSDTQQTAEARLENKIQTAIDALGGKATRRDLMRHLGCRREDLIKILSGLVDDQLLEETRVANKRGPATFIYSLIKKQK